MREGRRERMKIRNYTNLKVSEIEGKGMILGRGWRVRGWRVRGTKMTKGK